MSQKHFDPIPSKTASILKRKRIKSITRKKVLKMLAVMETNAQSTAGSSAGAVASGGGGSVENCPPTPETTANVEEFLTSGRTGRRNALPDILGQNAFVTSPDLTTKLQGLTTNDSPTDSAQPGTSKS
ncbi:unnamed protein product [Acanthoscelides obtectus]|uniref:cAMP-dependent protein kinase inhibitor beta n=1 Tax=Acanthoscelides obtectus TaxID=200917 RepID=A0A9P0KIF0_ACAOB|nr:unnamed protein product [Acanthoscelides obtectus]CAK1666695.1 hypothetical protein AOBTE_LOCUS25440 [Acanthoscelides obtectus]